MTGLDAVAGLFAADELTVLAAGSGVDGEGLCARADEQLDFPAVALPVAAGRLCDLRGRPRLPVEARALDFFAKVLAIRW